MILRDNSMAQRMLTTIEQINQFQYIICNQDSMSNPFEAFNISDDEETTVVETKVKRTHQEKRIYKQQQAEAVKAPVSAPVVTESFPERTKENAKQVRNTRAPPTPQTKKLGDGHYLDRRSGTGRVDKQRKEGGGWGNVGNVKDELKPEKYIKQTSEEVQPQSAPVEGEEQKPVEQKPEEPQAPTLEEYYKNKGIEINNTFEKKVAKKSDINAEWIKKEKLTLIESKEDKKNSERNSQNFVKFNSSKVGLDENVESLGLFAKKEQQQQRKPEEKRENKHEYKGKGKKDKVVIHEEDFPSL